MMDDINKTEMDGATVLTFQSAAAVGLIVEETEVPDWIAKEREYRGAFLTPEQARKIAAELLEFADAAQADYERTANMTLEERRAALDRALGR